MVSCIFGTLATNQAALTVLITGNGQVARSPHSNAYGLNQYFFGSVTSSAATLSITLPVRISTVRLQPGGGLFLQATGTAGQSLLFSTSTSLFGWSPWVLLPNPSGTVQVIDLAPTVPRKFYRAEQP